MTNYLQDPGSLGARARRQQRQVSPWQQPVDAQLEVRAVVHPRPKRCASCAVFDVLGTVLDIHCEASVSLQAARFPLSHAPHLVSSPFTSRYWFTGPSCELQLKPPSCRQAERFPLGHVAHSPGPDGSFGLESARLTLQAESFPLDEEQAAQLAGLVVSVRGLGAPGSTVAECRSPTAAFMADIYEVRCRCLC